MKLTEALKRNREFRRVYDKGQSAASRCMIVYCRRNGRDNPRNPGRAAGAPNRLGITVSAKLGGAVLRNRLRRRLRETYRLGEGALRRGFDIVIVARAPAEDTPFDELGAEFRRLCLKLGIRPAAESGEGKRR
ncbi:MAG: ribonuclease P protein component [Oscillospiraceae bacterium]|jgi:ribonuclease P protein component|nr:ribonuclease P protein component [Oscillospiraceae bacterium]